MPRRSQLALIIAAALHSGAVAAASICPVPTDAWQCALGTQGAAVGQWTCTGAASFADAPAAASDTSEAITLRAGSVESTDGDRYTLSGDVAVQRGPQRLNAERITVLRTDQTAATQGPARLENAELIAFAADIAANLKTGVSTLDNVRFALKSGAGNGRAARVLQQPNVSTMTNAQFTSCASDTPAWEIRASSVAINSRTDTATAKDFQLRLGGVPVFYWPYASFPTTDARKTGVLAPVLSLGTDGIDFTRSEERRVGKEC